ncbi:MAG TPA: T9SS type A sorting domain-containing protein [Bacteroidia bacterium]|nr:T9SS type A sorting domain-containing protein [Bacteroidia bacterium]
MKTKLLVTLSIAIFTFTANAQCHYIPATSTSIDTLSYTFSGGYFGSFGCAPIDPTYWMSGYGDSATVTFVNIQSYPSVRVWGLNSDDTAAIAVNGVDYPLDSTTAWYDPKVVCGSSPGPDGIHFSNGKITGPVVNNWSYQDIYINQANVSTILVRGISGAGWGYAGASVDCPPITSGTEENADDNFINVFPNPGNGKINIACLSTIDELKLTDLSGRIIYTQKPHEKSISLHLGIPGIYFLIVKSGNKIKNSRINICN